MRAFRPWSAVVAVLAFAGSNVATLAAQEFQVTGKVTLPDSVPLPGVSVQVQGSNTGVLTNSSGEYRIVLLNATDTLVFTLLGTRTQEIPVAGRNLLDVVLVPVPRAALDRMEVVGYVPNVRVPAQPCGRTYAPMPGSMYDPNWQRAHPELARLLLGNCYRAPTFLRPSPPGPD